MKLNTARTLWPIAVLILLVGSGCDTIRTAANSVANSRVSNTTQGVAANELKPTQCNSLSLSTYTQGSGDFEGGTANELLLGSSSSQLIRGRDGNDCLVGGAGTDELRGDAGTDVCIGTTGSTFTDCETIVYSGCSGTTMATIGNFWFSPNPITISAGCTVRWTNTSSTQHNSRSDTSVWSSPNLARNAYYEYTFNVSPGTYTYKCTLHPTQTGSVIVQ